MLLAIQFSRMLLTIRPLQNVRIYQYYRNLVSFRHRGDPGLLLRCINPQEAALVQDRCNPLFALVMHDIVI